MLRPEESQLDHRSLLPRRLIPAKPQISPADKKRNRRSLELQHEPPDGTKRGLLVSKTADSLTNPAESTKTIREDSADKRGFIETAGNTESCPKNTLIENFSRPNPFDISVELTPKIEIDECRKVSSSEQAKKLFFLSKVEEPCAKRGLLEPVTEESGAVTASAVSPGEERSKNARNWYAGYGYGTLPNHTPEKIVGGVVCPGVESREPARRSPGSGRRALDLLLQQGLRCLAARRTQHPVRRAASTHTDIHSDAHHAADNKTQGLRKCSTVLVLSSREPPPRAVNRLRAPSVCSRCSSILSLAGGSRYSLDAAGSGFVPAPRPAPIVCKLCLEDTPSESVTVIKGCGCAFCTKCMQAYVEFEVCNGAYSVSCPDARCRLGAALSLEEIGALVPPDCVQKHLRFRLNHDVSMDRTRAFCPRAGCEAVVCVRAASPALCPQCSHRFCPECQQEWHEGLTCAEAAGGASSSGPGAPLLADSELIKWCPMCRVPIEKDEGCAQMMCKRCKHVFCWYCLASLDDDFLLRHYDKGPCKNKLGHSRASVIWHRAQVVGIFAGFGLLLLVASPLLLLAAPCIVCCKCRLCNPNTKNLEEVEEIEAVVPEKEEELMSDDAEQSRPLSP